MKRGGKADSGDKFAKGFFGNRSAGTVGRAKHLERRMQELLTTERLEKPQAGGQMKLAPTEFFWFFCLTIGGIMCGAYLSGRVAGRIELRHQIRRGLNIMVLATAINLALNLTLDAPQWWWALPPVALFAFGWALMVPAVTITVLDLAPERRGMASSLQAFVGSVANGLVAGVISPLVMHSHALLALTSAGFLCVGLVA